MAESEWGETPPILYKYRAYRDTPGRPAASWVDETIRNGRIRFARVTEFNDPFECRPALVARHDDPARQEHAVRRWLFERFLERGRLPKDARKMANALINQPLSPALVPQSYQRELEKLISDNFLLYSMSATRESIPMWAHYGESHTGVCLHFRTDKLPFRVSYEVIYGQEYPTTNFPRDDDLKQFLKNCVLRKSTAWQAEEEYRMLRYIGDGSEAEQAMRHLGAGWDGQFAIFPPDRVVGITIGARMSENERLRLSALIRDYRPDLNVSQAILNPRGYKLDFEPIGAKTP